MSRNTSNVIPFDFRRLVRSDENLKTLEKFFGSESQSLDFYNMAGEPLSIYGPKPTIDLTVDKSLIQDLEIILMDAIERIRDRLEIENA